jgi:hypothetical protein
MRFDRSELGLGAPIGQHLFVRLENGTMVISPSIIASAKRWGDDNMAGQIVPAGGRAMRAAEVVDLLANRTSPRAQPGARKLLNDMATGPWRVVSPIHNSGDGTPHLTVELNRDRYHLRMDAQGCVFDITATIAGQRQRPSGNKPWVPPGAPS